MIVFPAFGGDIIRTTDRKHVGKSHSITVNKEKIFSFLDDDKIMVNSFHNNIIIETKLGKNLKVIAKDTNDESVEAFVHSNYPIIGIMWHPERMKDKNNYNFDLRYFVNKEISNLGVKNIENIKIDTFSNNEFFYSYRRSCINKAKDYGRCISVILMS